ncbi:MAG: carbohydrate ABC transporter permease [Alicyclobacillus sp.]|nr:carbohydrate ABC transporter permease [Alicyclobacillus sp.]
MRRGLKKRILWILCLLITLVSTVPILWILDTSLKTFIETQTTPPDVLPKHVQWQNYINVFMGPSAITSYLVNSSLVSITATVLTLALSVPAAYALARTPFARARDIQFWIISIRMMPAVAAMVPLSILFEKVGLSNNLWALILVYTMQNTSFAVWLLTIFFTNVPVEVEEAGMVDGLSRWWTMIKVAIPLASTGIWVIAAFVFIFCWNELPFALVLTGQGTQTLPVLLSTFASDTAVAYQNMATVAIIQIIPVTVITFLIQRNLLTGLSFGAVKG